MILLQNIMLPLESDFSDIPRLVSGVAGIPLNSIKSAAIYKKSVDARHKSNIMFCCSFLIDALNESKILSKNKKAVKYVKTEYVWKKASNTCIRPVVVGFGPAGMFAALALCRAGLKPIIIERGASIDKRICDVNEFFGGGELNLQSNIQFGEGGAGTFSDGKLNTGIKDSRISVVLGTFNRFGAPDKILYEAKPHIGTDILRDTVKNIRNEIISLGGEIRFNSCLTDLNISDNSLKSIEITTDGKAEIINAEYVILAIGHSARDTYKLLYERGLKMERKPFSVGARIEHLQSDINAALYGTFSKNPVFEAAAYKMAVHLPSGRGVYTFCMCPGGEVINASSELGGVCVNGMSNSARNGKNANSALLVDVRPDDLKNEGIFAGIDLQRSIERAAYSDKGVPFCYVGDILHKPVTDFNKVKPTVKPFAVKTDILKVLPEFAVNALREALPMFGKKIKGFDDANAILTFPETRSSSPVRILRGTDFQANDVCGIYPCGEGAGYAGGITSAAVDGLKAAEALIESTSQIGGKESNDPHKAVI